jgi:hypothetical protein
MQIAIQVERLLLEPADDDRWSLHGGCGRGPRETVWAAL